MKVKNIHERRLQADRRRAGELLADLGTKRDRIWPRRNWPAMRLDAPKEKGGRGGHGPIRYHVSEYVPGHRVAFHFEDRQLSRGLDGVHYFELEETGKNEITARHVIDVRLRGQALLFWPLLIRPLHDALVEDALDNFERASSERLANDRRRSGNRYGIYVRLLRKLIVR